MIIKMSKFGTLLNSRPTAREDSLRLKQIINGSAQNEEIILDFAMVEILTPSYADEVFFYLFDQYGKERVKTINIETPIVRDTISFISHK